MIGYKQVLKKGNQYEAEHPGLFEHNVETGQADEVCALVYTSGTCGTCAQRSGPHLPVHESRVPTIF